MRFYYYVGKITDSERFVFANLFEKLIQYFENKLMNDEQLFRMLLVYLFNIYDHAIYRGFEFSTNIEIVRENLGDKLYPEFYNKLEIFNEIYGKEIENIEEYRDLINVHSYDDKVKFIQHFYEYILTGNIINKR